MLANRPSHGYELIKSLEDHSHGLYVPSPGMVYPALTYLEEIGYASAEMDGTKKRYSLTEAGMSHYEQNHEAAKSILSDMERIGAQMAQARQAVEDGLVPEQGRYDTTSEELDKARRELREAQHKEESYTPEEARSIAEILNRAAADIRRASQPKTQTGMGAILDPAASALQPEFPTAPVGTDSADVVFAAILHRRSMGLSRLKPDPVDRKLIERMLEAANWAPSHGDTEPWRFTVFAGEGRETLAELFANAHGEETAGNAEANASDGARKRAFASPVWISIGMSPGA